MKVLKKLPFFEEGFQGQVLPVGKSFSGMEPIFHQETKKLDVCIVYDIFYLYKNKLYEIETIQTQELDISSGNVVMEKEEEQVNYYELGLADIGKNEIIQEKIVEQQEYTYFDIEQYKTVTAERMEDNNKVTLKFEDEELKDIFFSEDGEWDFAGWYEKMSECAEEEKEFQCVCTKEDFVERIRSFLK